MLIAIIQSGCSGLKHLKGEERMLSRQQIHAPKAIDKDDLRGLYAQQTNRELFGLRRLHIHYLVGIYYSGLRAYDQEKYIAKRARTREKYDRKIDSLPPTRIKKINNLEFKKQKALNRVNNKIENGNNRMQWGEPIAVLDTATVQLARSRFSEYLFSKGYFKNTVKAELDSIAKRKVDVHYYLDPGSGYFIDTIYYDIGDTAVAALVQENNKGTFIKKGDQYDQDKFSRERERLDLLMKDNGYYDFSRQYIEFDVDSAYQKENMLAVRVAIKDPATREHHKKFSITEVNFIIERPVAVKNIPKSSRTYRGTNYSFYKDEYNLRILSQRVFLEPKALYSRTKTFDTQRQLANLDAFKFVNINYDTANGKFISNIFVSPLDRYQISTEGGVNVTQGFPGPFVNLSFKKRNVFQGLEIFDLTGHFGFEGVASATSDQNIYKSTEAGINAGLTFPQIIFPLGERIKNNLGRFNPKTRVQVGYAYTDRPEYKRTYLTMAGTYSFQNKRTTQYSFSFVNISVIDTLNIANSFRNFLDEQRLAGNYSLVNSFYPSFVTSMIFGLTWNPDNYGNKEKSAIFIRSVFESGGTLWNFVKPDAITEGGLQIYKYLRFSFDVRKNIILDRNTVLAYRVNTGIAYPYGDNRTVPYEKFFFAGGSNSVRAWRPRRLGPGSFKPNFSTNPDGNGLFDYSIEKPAQILLEGSVEVRKNLVGFLDGALFVDIGNVWTIDPLDKVVNKEVVANGNSQFKIDQFYKEFGVGTGFGLRFDFAFLILRFDVGMKVYDPARDEGDRFVLDKVRFFGPYGVNKEPVIYNVGINYPF